MKIAVIGAGIVGITTAFELARDGHDVTVFDRNNAAAEGASFANTGLMSTSMTSPWSLPAWAKPSYLPLLRSLQSVSLKKGMSQQDIRWLWAWGKAAGSPADAPCRQAAHALATYSQNQLRTISKETSLEFQNSNGHLLAVSTEASYQTLAPTISTLKANGIPFSELTPTEAIKIEPSLGLSDPIHCAIYLPHDGVGNCRQFALLLRSHAQKYGVKFQYGAAATEISGGSSPSVMLLNSVNPLTFDRIVVCTGDFSGLLKGHLKIRLPIAALHGYSVSTAIREPLNAPKISVMDVETGIVIARIGDRLRISGGAELGAKLRSTDTVAVQALFRTLHRYFPGAIQYPAGTQIWKGARILTSDGLPMIGTCDTPGIWINLAHGGNGWGNACGSARLLADLLSQRKPALDAESFSPSRTSGS